MDLFKDYYAILGIGMHASAEEIKRAYRSKSLQWHPDKNPGRDTTIEMQDINEAYAILKDAEKRRRYDVEYEVFVSSIHDCEVYSGGFREESAHGKWSYDYEVKDQKVADDIKEARRYARELIDEFKRSFKSNMRVASKAIWDEIKWYLIIMAVMAFFGFIILMSNM